MEVFRLIMGGCLSDVRGGQQAIGGTKSAGPTSSATTTTTTNDAIDHFYRSHGCQGLFTLLELSLSAKQLRNMDVFSKSDPMAVVYAKRSDGNLEEIGRTEVIMNSLDPAWITKISIAYQFEIVQPLVFRVYDVDTKYHNIFPFDKLKIQKSVGDLEKLYVGQVGEHFVIPSTSRKDYMKVVLKGQLHVDRFIQKTQYSFLDYISSGFELNFMVAVDFTASNGDPHSYTSLHYIDPTGRLNSYQRAIYEVGEVIQFYDSDKRFPAWGFGGKTHEGVVSHCFNLNGSRNESELRSYLLSLSILIVGVGNADFKAMEILDADNGKRLQSSTGRVATRDVVQFVPMRQVQGNQLSVVQSLLEELPGQFLTYMRSRDIKPLYINEPQVSGVSVDGPQVPYLPSQM
ncbi:protein BONZAI 3-like [Papaver somniferum]|uniref:protein BONZAI 3-like n=1 Tax=Papaver somniferum TaxID=3469 RepID=UPI000E702E68|nr:protein BONZAI 3-like [Papaver somniferum]